MSRARQAVKLLLSEGSNIACDAAQDLLDDGCVPSFYDEQKFQRYVSGNFEPSVKNDERTIGYVALLLQWFL